MGYRRVWAVVRNSGTEVNQKRVGKVLRDNKLNLPSSKHRVKTKKRNLFYPHGPDQVWHTDVTYVPTEFGMTYLMCIQDYFTKEWQGISLFQIMYSKVCRIFFGECCPTDIQWINPRMSGIEGSQWSTVHITRVHG